MKLRKLLPLLAFGALALVGCKKNDLGTEPVNPQKGTTFMSFSFSADELLRADGDKESTDYNSIGEWNGRDKFVNALLYIFPDGKFDNPDQPYQKIEITEITPSAQNGMYKAKNAWKTTPGKKVVFAVLNVTDGELKNKLDEAAKKSYVEFKKVYNAAYELAKDNGNPPTDVKEVEESFAKEEGANGDKKDVIVMTGVPKEITVADNVTKEQAEGGQNQVKLNVRRIIARVVTTGIFAKAATNDIDGVTFEKKDKEQKTVFTLKNIEWSYAQYEKTSYLLFQDINGGNEYTPASMVKTPNYSYVGDKVLNTWKTAADQKYSYALVKNEKFFPLENFSRDSHNNEANVIAIVAKNMHFITETTHHSYTKDQVSGKPDYYSKGATPYVVVKAQYVPSKEQMGFKDGGKDRDTYTEGQNLYYGLIDGKFYGDYELAKKNNSLGAAPKTTLRSVPNVPKPNDNVITYVNGYTYYLVWLNPDVIDVKNWVNSPVVRNNIYHINITGFDRIGFSGNPFIPGNDNPTPPDEDEPGLPKPGDPLFSPETYMHATVKIIKWGVHSYDINL